MTGTTGTAGADGSLSPDVRAQLERVLASDLFAGSARLSRLLRYTVERTLDGRGDEIKEYVLGAEVFDRGADYDPRLDSIVRVEARRLRAKLDEYYAGPGAADPITIRLRPGSYVPQFETRIAPAASAGAGASAGENAGPALRSAKREGGHRPMWIGVGAALVVATIAMLAWRPAAPARADGGPGRLAVLPATHYPADAEAAALAERITDGVTGELVRIGRLEIVSRTSTRQFGGERRSVRDIAEALDADWIIEATVHREAGGVRVEVRLVDPRRDRKVWVERFTGDIGNLSDLDRRVAAAIDVEVARAAAQGAAGAR